MECPACHTPNTDGARFCAKCGALLPASGDQKDPLIGSVVGGRFRITGVLGEGGMGRVYNGEQQMGTSVRKVAVKTLLAQYAKDPQVLARFMRECGTVSELEHPNTIKVYDFGQTDSGELYIAMELLTGQSLESVLEKGPMPAERVDRILQQVTGSLSEAHEKGIVHRDLKPANIYLTTRAGEEDYVKVLDFGIAKKDEKHSKHEQKLTQQGTVLGTPPYMSPEQFKGQELDQRSDIYSLGVMTYEMLTGRLPFDADTPWAWATQHMTAQPFPFETVPIGGQIPPKMKSAVMRALSKDKEKRQQNAKEFFEELTLGGTRSSRTSAHDVAHAASGTAVMSAHNPSSKAGTQIGEPLMAHSTTAPSPGTIVDSSGNASNPAIQASSSPSIPMGQPSVPTGSGQAYPAPPAQPNKGSGGAILAIVGGLVLLGAVATGIFFATRKPPHHPIAENTTAPPSTSPATRPTEGPTNTAHTTTAGIDPLCASIISEIQNRPKDAPPFTSEQLMKLITTYKERTGCVTKAGNKEAARAIGGAVSEFVQRTGTCAGANVAAAAAQIKEPGAYEYLRDQKHCKMPALVGVP